MKAEKLMNIHLSALNIQRQIEHYRLLEQDIQKIQQIQVALSVLPWQQKLIQVLSDDFKLQQEMLQAVPEKLIQTMKIAEQDLRAADLYRHLIEIAPLYAQERDLLAHVQLIKASIQPFSKYFSLLASSGVIAASFQRLNAGIAEAAFLAEFDLTEAVPAEATGPREETIARRIESELIEVVPPAALLVLRQVDFAPITLLDRVLRDPALMYRMQPRDFERFVARLVEQLEFEDVRLTPSTHDGGRDVLAKKTVAGMPILFVFECKRFSPKYPIGLGIMRALLGTVSARETTADRGVLVTTSRFTRGAGKLILTEPKLAGVDYDGIVAWLHNAACRR